MKIMTKAQFGAYLQDKSGTTLSISLLQRETGLNGPTACDWLCEWMKEHGEIVDIHQGSWLIPKLETRNKKAKGKSK